MRVQGPSGAPCYDRHRSAGISRPFVRQLCRWLGVGRTWYYTCPTAEERAARDVALRDAIERLILAFPGYGYRRVTHALQREGWAVNHKRVLRIMRQESLLCHLKRQFVAPPTRPRLPDLSQSAGRRGRDRARPGVGRRYHLCPVAHDLCLSGLCARCLLAPLCRLAALAPIDTQLTLDALEMALTQRQPAPGLIHHSDRGVQYASRVCRPPGTGRGPGQHVGEGQSLRQRQSREFLQNAQTRGGVSPGLPDLCRGGSQPRPLH